jgi:hypothetical protein
MSQSLGRYEVSESGVKINSRFAGGNIGGGMAPATPILISGVLFVDPFAPGQTHGAFQKMLKKRNPDELDVTCLIFAEQIARAPKIQVSSMEMLSYGRGPRPESQHRLAWRKPHQC